MLGNLAATARASSGAFVWLLGDDDLMIDGAIENVLEGLARHPDVEMAYMNYAYTQFDDPAQLDDVSRLVADATPIAEGGPNRYVAELREVAGLNENLFTAIYACAFRRDHALRAYQLDTRGAPFTSLATCVPSSVYALAALQDRPAWWVGEPALVVNMNVSWLRWALLWHLERMPDLFEEAERRGVDPERLDVYRLQAPRRGRAVGSDGVLRGGGRDSLELLARAPPRALEAPARSSASAISTVSAAPTRRRGRRAASSSIRFRRTSCSSGTAFDRSGVPAAPLRSQR